MGLSSCNGCNYNGPNGCAKPGWLGLCYSGESHTGKIAEDRAYKAGYAAAKEELMSKFIKRISKKR